MNRPAAFDLAIQARIPPALAALHNFILQFDPSDIEDFLNDPGVVDDEPSAADYTRDIYGRLAEGAPSREEKEKAEKLRDQIAEKMWIQYQEWLAKVGLSDDIDM